MLRPASPSAATARRAIRKLSTWSAIWAGELVARRDRGSAAPPARIWSVVVWSVIRPFASPRKPARG